MEKEKCVMCGNLTPYEFETNINLRYGYIEGMGQLCSDCYNDKPKKDSITIPISVVRETPNDMELGEKIRYLTNLKI
jgi:hypothetical protein